MFIAQNIGTCDGLITGSNSIKATATDYTVIFAIFFLPALRFWVSLVAFCSRQSLSDPLCLGCGACISKGEEGCPHRTITRQIEAKLLEADGVILAAPVYGHHITGLMKNFIDHFCYFFHRPRFFDKVALVVSTTGGTGLKETMGYLKFTAIGWGFHVIGSLGVVSWLFKKNEAYRAEKLTEINGLATRMVKLMKTKKRPAPSLFELMFFRGMRYKAKNMQVDREYWEERSWLNSDYFVKGPIDPVKMLLARLAEKMMGLMYQVKMGKYLK